MNPQRKEDRAGNNATHPRRNVHVPVRTGTQLRSSPTSTPPRAVIPLLDEEKPTLSSRSSPGWIQKILLDHPKRSIVLGVLLLAIGYTSFTQLSQKDETSSKDAQTTYNGPATLSRNETPKFKTVLPAGKSIQDYGGWTRVSPPDREPVYAYVDKIDGIPINVSEQKLPEELRKDTEENLGKLAVDFRAEQKLKVGNITAHIGTSVKGPQSVIFAKDDLLILIKSAVKLSDEQWIAYISSLE